MRTLTLTLAALMLAACNPPESPRQTNASAKGQAAPAPVSAPAPEAAQPAKDCGNYVAALFDDLVARKATGMTEREALAELSARGDFALGYVVDGVFGNRFGEGGSAMARVDTLTACRRMAKGETLY